MQTIDEAINYAAGDLPEGCDINIRIESGGWAVELVMDDQVFLVEEENIIDSVVAATDQAKAIDSYDCRDCPN
tara:strand:+ start:38916 stop:39134 length:219 start_codon:yes stop_codon:yes gene_type:complete